jgi:Lipocalin-like domain
VKQGGEKPREQEETMPFRSRREVIVNLGRLLLALATAVASMLPWRRLAAANMQMGPLKTRIVGTWKLTDATARDPDGKALPKPYGPKGMGLVTLNEDGRMMAVLCDGRPALPDGIARDYSSYCGNYTFDGQTLVTRVDASASARIALGSDQRRKVRFEGKRMVLTPPAAVVNGVAQQRETWWERISSVPA